MPFFDIPLKSSLGALGALMITAIAPSALAQQECGDTTCDAGYECVSFDAPCPEIACAEGEDCDFECEAGEEFYCQRAACEDDSECGDHMVCATLERFNCPEIDFACDPDGPCEEPEKVECTPEEFNECTPRWELPCDSDNDCGDGFTCETQEICQCGGAASSGVATSEPAPPPDEEKSVDGGVPDEENVEMLQPVEPGDEQLVREDCGCEESDQKWCEVVEQACESDSDCLDDWTCIDNPEGACWADSEGNSGCEPADPAKVCAPPGVDFIGIGIAETAAASGEAASSGLAPEPAQDGSEATSSSAGSDSADISEPGDSAEPDEDDVQDLSDTNDEDVDEAAEDQDDEEPTVAELEEDSDNSDKDDVETEAAGDSKSSSGGGCSVTTGAATGDSLSLLLIALGAALSRRRRKAA